MKAAADPVGYELTARERAHITNMSERAKEEIRQAVLALVTTLVDPVAEAQAHQTAPEPTGTGFLGRDVAEHVYRPSAPPLFRQSA